MPFRVLHTIHSILTNVEPIKYTISPKSQQIVDQNSSTTYVWDLIWTLYCKCAPHLGGLNTYLYADIDTLFIHPSKDLGMIYSRTLNIQNNIHNSREIISTNILTKIYLEFLLPCQDIGISPFISAKQSSFTNFLPTHGHHAIYKDDIRTTTTEFLEHCNAPFILNQYVLYLHIYQSLVLAGIHYAPISSDNQRHQPIQHTTTEDPYVNLTMYLNSVGTTDKEFAPVIAYGINNSLIALTLIRLFSVFGG